MMAIQSMVQLPSLPWDDKLVVLDLKAAFKEKFPEYARESAVPILSHVSGCQAAYLLSGFKA